MSRIHYVMLLDRNADGYILRAQTDSGRIIEVKATAGNQAAAAALWGGSGLSYEFRGGVAYYVSRDELDERDGVQS